MKKYCPTKSMLAIIVKSWQVFDIWNPFQLIRIKVRGEEVLSETTASLRNVWEETSFRLERLQTNPCCVEQEEAGLSKRVAPPYHLTFDPQAMMEEAALRDGGVRNGVGRVAKAR